MECVRDFTKGFSLIDIFAFLVPGTLFLIFSLPIWNDSLVKLFFSPMQMAFGDTIWLRIIYVLTLGYVLGFIFSEAGRVVGNIIRWPRKKKNQDADDASKKEEAMEKNKVFPTAELYRKAQLFKSFSQFCRSMEIVVLLLAGEISFLLSISCNKKIGCIVVTVIVEILLAHRSKRFDQRSSDYIEVCRRSILYHDGAERQE